MAIYYLDSPLKGSDTEKLKTGDTVFISGKAFTCRSMLHRYIFDEGNTMPFSTKERNVLIHTGPVVVREYDSESVNEKGRWRLVSFMPTSSIRFEKWGARSVDEWGLKLIVGKTTMGRDTMNMMKNKGCVHVSPQSVSPNLWLNSIRIENVFLFDEFGSIEASWQLELDKLGPFVVDIDSRGNNLFDEIDIKIAANKALSLKLLNIDEEFNYTKLY